MPFEPDNRVRVIAEAYALDAVDAALKSFGVRLDWTVESLPAVERILATLHDAIPQQRPSKATIDTFAKAFGSYVGEVVLRAHGGHWGWVTLPEGRIVGMQVTDPRLELWPWARVFNRLKNGPEDNVWHYYQLTVLYEKAHPSGA